ncbi:hypothetical protein [Microbacterium sp. PA5]|uniref:hypothetical protein n=1 Tax=Microbacterium sp. PA5 TaxID=3416654 RepID=UPI003CED4F37
MPVHFGEVVTAGKYGLHLTRDQYAAPNPRSSIYARPEHFTAEQWDQRARHFIDADQRFYTDEVVQMLRENALLNFDLNMAFFSQIDELRFLIDLEEAVTAARLEPVHDLRKWDGVEGVYVMVFDKYKQAYVGQSWNIRKRVRSHWSGTKQFDRLVFGPVHSSVLSVDSFRALDNTRIFAVRSRRADLVESRFVDRLNPDYLLNRVGGGRPDETRLRFMGLEGKRRQLLASETPTEPDALPTGGDSATVAPAVDQSK